MTVEFLVVPLSCGTGKIVVSVGEEAWKLLKERKYQETPIYIWFLYLNYTLLYLSFNYTIVL